MPAAMEEQGQTARGFDSSERERACARRQRKPVSRCDPILFPRVGLRTFFAKLASGGDFSSGLAEAFARVA
jgi:hypothetical protein